MGFIKWVSLIFSLCIFVPTPTSSDSFLKEGSSQIPLNFLNLAKRTELVDWMVGIRRSIHENPELGFDEFETSKLIRTELDKMGIPYKHPFAVTGVVGFIGTGNPPFVGIRADMEVLAMQEGVEWEHKSKVPGEMHEGHDAHVAMLLGAAKMLQEHHNNLKGTVVLVFQPAEEGGGEAKKMLDNGALENVEAIFGLHISSKYPIGTVATRPGPILAASGFFEAVISGKGGHAAIPQHTIDPILAASNVIVSLQHLVSREADPLDSQVVTIGKFQGGGAFNVIPDSVTIGGSFRAFSKESFEKLKQRIKEVITGQAAVQRCNATINFNTKGKPSYPVTVNNKDLHEHFQNVVEDMLGVKNIIEMQPLMGAEDDFSFFAEAIPGYFYYVGMHNETRGRLESGHSPCFTVNEEALPYGAALHASLATRYLLQNQPKSTPLQGNLHDELLDSFGLPTSTLGIGAMSSDNNFVQPAIPRLDEHYEHWSMLMENFLRSKEYWHIVENGVAEEDADAALTDAERKVLADQKLKDLKAKNYFFHAIDRTILETILTKDTAKGIWDSLRQKYQGNARVKRAQLQALRKDFEVLHMKEGESVNDFFARTLTITNKMRSLGEKMNDVTMNEKILRSMSSKFDYVVCSIEESKYLDHMSIDELQSSLQVHEQRMSSHVIEE